MSASVNVLDSWNLYKILYTNCSLKRKANLYERLEKANGVEALEQNQKGNLSAIHITTITIGSASSTNPQFWLVKDGCCIEECLSSVTSCPSLGAILLDTLSNWISFWW